MRTHDHRGNLTRASSSASVLRSSVKTAQTLAYSSRLFRSDGLTLILGTYVAWAEGVRGLPLVAEPLFDPQGGSSTCTSATRFARKRLLEVERRFFTAPVLMRASEVFLPRDGVAKARPVGAQLMLATVLTLRGRRVSDMGSRPTNPTDARQGRRPDVPRLGLRASSWGILSLRRGDVQDGNRRHVYVPQPRHDSGRTDGHPVGGPPSVS